MNGLSLGEGDANVDSSITRVLIAGEIITLPTVLPPGGTCRLEFRGSSWSAVNGGKSVIEAGSTARIVRVDGLTLVVQPHA